MCEDFSYQNLQGRSFSGLDLTGANFSHADIRGVKFNNTILRGANFSCAKTGLPRRWRIVLVDSLCFLTGISGVFSGLAGYLVTLVLDRTKPDNFNAGVISSIMLVALFMIIIRYGLGVVSLAFVIAIAIAVDIALGFNFAIAIILASALGTTSAAVGAACVAVAIVIASIITSTVLTRLVVTVALASAVSVAIILTRTSLIAKVVAIAVSVAFTLLGVYVGRRSLVNDEKYTLMQKLVMTLATKGTSFHGADLTDADFTKATLKSTDFRNAILTRTCWHLVKWHFGVIITL
jgi:hypothetical protein